jgi:mannose-6-phosphate isomerase-like protein (cupin superfamily)
MVPEAKLEETEAGLVPASTGWFVMNAREARWFDKPGQGRSVPLTGYDEYEAETFFPMLGMAIRVVPPGEPTGTYHWETEQEDFLVLSGQGLLIVEGQERPLKQWDFVHCPPKTRHAFVGVGEAPFVLLCASSRQFQKDGPWATPAPTRQPLATTPAPPKTRRTTRSRTPGSRPRSQRVIARAGSRTPGEGASAFV